MVLDIRRHQELFDGDMFDSQIHIIGAGATGSWLTLILAKLGVKGENINVYDFDHVAEHNVPNQFFEMSDVTKQKTESLRDQIKKFAGSDVKIHGKFEQQRLSGYVFLMVDSMAERKRIWDESIKMKMSVKTLIEPRMGLDMGRIYNVVPTDLTQIRKYEDTFYSDEEAEVSACGTAQTVITTSTSIASTCARQLINQEAGVDNPNELLIDLKYNNLFTEEW